MTRRLVALAILSTACFAEAVPVFLIAGQSNAAGQGVTSEIPRGERVLPEVLYYRYHSDGAIGSVANAAPVLQGTFGPEFGAVKTLAGELGSDFAVVKVAASATPLAMTTSLDWSPDSTGELYDRLLFEADSAVADLSALGETAQFAGLFWMQGEQDAKSGNRGGGSAVPYAQPDTANAYEDNLNEFIGSLRTDLSAPDLPTFIGQINIGDDPTISTRPDSPHNTRFGEWDYTPVIQEAQSAVAAGDPNAYLIPTGDLPLLSDYLHFDTAGQVELGERFAEAYLATVPEPTAAVMVLSALAAGVRRRE